VGTAWPAWAAEAVTVNFRSCGKIAYIPTEEAEDQAEQMRQDGLPDAYAYECPAKSAKGTAHWHTTSGRPPWERHRRRR
jgi:hypothetical protein